MSILVSRFYPLLVKGQIIYRSLVGEISEQDRILKFEKNKITDQKQFLQN